MRDQLDGQNNSKWTVMDFTGQPKRLKSDDLQKWTVLSTKTGPIFRTEILGSKEWKLGGLR